MFFDDFYDKIISKKQHERFMTERKIDREMSNHLTALSVVCNMFEYTGTDIHFSFNRLLDYYANVVGMYCAIEHENEVCIFPCVRTGRPNEWNMPESVMVNFNGREANKVFNIKTDRVIVGYNDKLMRSNADICYYADAMCDTDLSELYALIYSRVNPLPVVKNGKDAEKVKQAINDILEGKITTISLDTKLEDIIEGYKLIDTLDILKPEHAHNLQYLTQYYDSKLSRFLCKYGLPTQFAGKMAQMSTEEIKGYDAYSRVQPLAMLEERKRFIDEVNNMFDTDYTVDFSEAFAHLKVENFTCEKSIDENGGVDSGNEDGVNMPKSAQDTDD